MENLVKKLNSLKNVTQSQYDETIKKYAKAEVLKELSEAGVSIDEISTQEFQELLEDKIKASKAFAKGAMVAGGALLVLDLLG